MKNVDGDETTLTTKYNKYELSTKITGNQRWTKYTTPLLAWKYRYCWSNITPLQVKVVKTDFYLSKSTEVLTFKSTEVPKVNFLFLCQSTVLLLLYVILAIPLKQHYTYWIHWLVVCSIFGIKSF